MKTNEILQKDVQEAIKWEPLLKAAQIGVTAKEGVVTLTGSVDSYAKKLEAEDAAKNVAGVKAVVEKIVIEFRHLGVKSDNEVAGEVVAAFTHNWEVPDENLKVTVEQGWVTLEGEIQWNYQKEAAQKAVRHLAGVKGVTNNIKVIPNDHDSIEKRAIEHALARNWSIESKDIQVDVTGDRVTLNGTVDSVYQKDEAGRIAWNAPGVWSVNNELVIDYDYDSGHKLNRRTMGKEIAHVPVDISL